VKSRKTTASEKNIEPRGWPTVFALVFGLFLGLALVKFGNPIILDSKVSAPGTFSEALSQSWPPRWSFWFLLPILFAGVWIAVGKKKSWPGLRWLWVLPLAWFVWQIFSATQSVDHTLTLLTLGHFGGCVACYFLGVWLIGSETSFRFLLIGILAGFAFCLVRATDQKLFEFPQERQALLEGERTGWTNFTADAVQQLKADDVIVTTNGVDVANPMMLQKYEKSRVFGTLVYPNALAGVVLLLFPVTITLAVFGTRRFRIFTRVAAIALALFLAFGVLFWTGSKSGWLIALVMLGAWLFRLKWSARLKYLALALVAIAGIGAFAVRFHSYFSAGATSVSARFDYWHAAIQNTAQHPLFGSGPGTFEHPYALLKRPESEMARLVHNDYLEQFSDSGIPGGVSYAAWIGLLFVVVARKFWRAPEPIYFAVVLGLAGWFAQGLSEFSLYIPALAWTAFALAGAVLNVAGNQFDKIRAAR
jgi:hypothetical protein